jgi:hypothetical protein
MHSKQHQAIFWLHSQPENAADWQTMLADPILRSRDGMDRHTGNPTPGNASPATTPSTPSNIGPQRRRLLRDPACARPRCDVLSEGRRRMIPAARPHLRSQDFGPLV